MYLNLQSYIFVSFLSFSIIITILLSKNAKTMFVKAQVLIFGCFLLCFSLRVSSSICFRMEENFYQGILSSQTFTCVNLENNSCSTFEVSNSENYGLIWTSTHTLPKESVEIAKLTFHNNGKNYEVFLHEVSFDSPKIDPIVEYKNKYYAFSHPVLQQNQLLNFPHSFSEICLKRILQ